jgi:hypothetical protein
MNYDMSYEQNLSMLLNHPYFLLIGIFKHEWWLACRHGEIGEHLFQKLLFGQAVF